MLGADLTTLQSHVAEPELVKEAIGEIDAALEALFLRTESPHTSYTWFRRLAQGNLSVKNKRYESH